MLETLLVMAPTKRKLPILLSLDCMISADQADRHLISGVEADIPDVDVFIAGTSCVDFSSLNTNKAREFAGLATAIKRWKVVDKAHKGELTVSHLSHAEWRDTMEEMTAKRDTKNTSTTTFAAAMNFLRERQPKIAIFENVESAPWPSVLAYVLPLCGYAGTVQKLDTKNYYLPQTRSRAYLIAFSHKFFGVEGAKALCKLVGTKVKKLEYRYSSSVTDFLLSINSHELHRARNEMELASQMTRDKDTDWSFSKSRHTAFRRLMDIPDERRWLRWSETGSSRAPAKMWKPWEAKQPNRVRDLLDIVYLVAVAGKNPKHGSYDPAFKAQIIDCSQNVDRVNITTAFGATGCLTPNAIPVLTLEARPITGSEALKLQGMPIENFDMSIETQAQLQDLAGNAMTTTVVGAAILASFQSVAELDRESDKGWLAKLFPRRGYEMVEGKDRNTFDAAGADINLGDRLQLEDVVLSAHSLPRDSVHEILQLAHKARRRCVCHHVLAYSSMELYECSTCGASFCKSCKGNPDHQLGKAPESYEQIGCLTYANAEYQLRQFFPSVLPLLSTIHADFAQGLHTTLLASSLTERQVSVYADAVLAGLCQTTYQLGFVEITDAIRVEYVSKDDFILRAIVTSDEITWYLHLDQWSSAGKELSGHLTTSQPIARAIVKPNAPSQFPSSWKVWSPRGVIINMTCSLKEHGAICLASINIAQQVPISVEREILGLKGIHWSYHPECGFPENALWVTERPSQKLYLFKDVNPIGAAVEDEFVISPVNREMGRTPRAEVRPVLLRFSAQHQIHQNLSSLSGQKSGRESDSFNVQGYITGWWACPVDQSFRIPLFTNDLAQLSLQGFPMCPPVEVRSSSHDPTLSLHSPSNTVCTGDFPCNRDQVLLSMSLPVLGKSHRTLDETLKTLRDLDLTQQLDLSEFARLIGPCYTAVERRLLHELCNTGTIQVWTDVKLLADCSNCAPKLPVSIWAKQGAKASKQGGSIVAHSLTNDQQRYNNCLKRKPLAFRIDHNVDAGRYPHPQKQDGISYVDIRFVARAHTLLQQARAYLPRHPSYYDDTCVTQGSFAVDFGVLENPRPKLTPISVQAPLSLQELAIDTNASQPKGFKSSEVLFDEQLATLEWMLSREAASDDQVIFVEREIAEVYVDHLRLRVNAKAARSLVRRGRVVADSVGFGKTIVCLGLIDRQYHTDRAQFLASRKNNSQLQGLCHLHATLVIVPNQLTRQWAGEGRRFLKSEYNICVIQSFSDIQKYGINALEKADIIICSNKIFQDVKYQKQLSDLCDPNDMDVRALPKVYRAWYQQFHKIFRQVRGKILGLHRVKGTTAEGGLLKELKQDLVDRNKTEDDIAFHVSTNAAKSVPSLLLELFSFSRVIWDEFPYENVAVTEFVANCATNSKWMLSGTPPLATLGDICKVAYLFNIHLARPLPLVGGRQPPVCEYAPPCPLSQLEEAELYQSRPSPMILQERHSQAAEFVRTFMRKNCRNMETINSFENPVVLTASTNSLLAYFQLQQELSSRAYNANAVSAETRRRLMSRVDWKVSKLGKDRTMEALMLRASTSFEDVKYQLAVLTETDKQSILAVAKAMYEASIKTVHDVEDRCRELFGRAFYLGYRIAYINLKNHTDKADNQEERQFSYYETLWGLVQNILSLNTESYSGWDALESGLRVLIWDKEYHVRIDNLRGPPVIAFMQTVSDREAWEHVTRQVWNKMCFGEVPEPEPASSVKSTDGSSRGIVLAQKKEWLKRFGTLLLKTPLHSRRWFLIDKLKKGDFEPLRAILEMEWKYKVSWEAQYREEAGKSGKSHELVPINALRHPLTPVLDEFDFPELQKVDQERADNMDKPNPTAVKAVDGLMKARFGTRKLARGDWQEECARRGLACKTTDKANDLAKRVALAEENRAFDDAYICPESCPLLVEALPLEGKQRIRGGNMEVVFDRFMHTVDKLTLTLERLSAAHAKKNLQETIWQVLNRGEKWDCSCCSEHGTNALTTHQVSLLCGHVQCSMSRDSKLNSSVCGVRDCTHSIKGVCISISKLIENPRVVEARNFGPGALAKEPASYLDTEEEGKGAKVNAVTSLVLAMHKADQIVIFVQNRALIGDIYAALKEEQIGHVTAAELEKDEAAALEQFKFDPRKKVLVQVINSEQAAGSNLHNANHVIFVSPLITRNQAEWDAQMKQALGRCVRFRQTKTVHVYHLVVDETIEVDTLEWRMKKEILVPDGKAVGRFDDMTPSEFLDRFDARQTDAPDGEARAISVVPRDDIQLLMGDDYVSLTTARTTKTVAAAEAVAAGSREKHADKDVIMSES